MSPNRYWVDSHKRTVPVFYELEDVRVRQLQASFPETVQLWVAYQFRVRELFPVSDVNHLPEIAARIGVELHNNYVLAYSPSGMQHDGRHHRVRVQVLPQSGSAPLNVDWRAGYRAPIQ